MLVYQDKVSGDELLSDSFTYEEIHNGVIWEVEGKEQPPYDKKGFMAYIKKYLKILTPLVPEERQATFKKDVEGAVKFLLSKLGDFQFFVGESMKDDSSTVFAYYKDGKSDPTFLYFADALKEVKC
jgi:hypothetical protein